MTESLDESRRQLVSDNIGLAKSVAKQYAHLAGPGLGRDDIASVALLALCGAAAEFDPARGTKFSSYAAILCKRAIRVAALDGGLIHTPHYLRDRDAAHAAAREKHRVHRDRARTAANDEAMALLFGRDEGPVTQAIRNEEIERARAAVALIPTLSAREQQVIKSYYLDGRPDTEIGSPLGIRTRQVFNVRHAALAGLRKRLAQRAI